MPKILKSVFLHGRTFLPDNQQDEEDLPEYITAEDAERLANLEDPVLEEGFEGRRESYEDDVATPNVPEEEHRPRGTEKTEDGEPVVPEGTYPEKTEQVNSGPTWATPPAAKTSKPKAQPKE